MTEGFPQATAADMQPHTIYTNSTPNDPTVVLPEAAAAKFIQLRQRASDLHAATPPFEAVQEQSHAKIRHEKRIADLTRVRAEGGFGLGELAPQVVVERRELERAQKELARLSALKEARGARWNAAKQLETRVIDWCLAGGVPANCTLEVVEDEPIGSLLKKCETVASAIERFRHRLRELRADLHRVRSSPWPSSLAKQKAKALIEQLGEAGAPNIDRCVEHNLPLDFPMTMLTAQVHNVDTAPAAVAFTQTTDTLGLLCWLFPQEILRKVSTAIDEASDDKNSLNEQQREEALATINSDELEIHRRICALTWAAESKGEVIDFAADTPPEAVIGVRCVNAPRAAPVGTSPEHVITFGGR